MLAKEACLPFLTHCEQERRLSANTISAYSQNLNEFRSRLGEVDVASVTGEDLVRFVTYLREPRKLAPATIKRRVACLKGLFAWLRRRGTIPANPFHEVELRVRVPDRLPRSLGPGAAKLLLEAADASPTLTRLSVRLLLATSMRVGELAGLRISDVDLSEGTVRLVGKGDRQRRAFLANVPLVEDLARYLAVE